ncbi:MAG TPA: DNA methyltransferase [Syntrophobacteraceae bacterium]|nr:DNA methyltransferase [Syntrophobacteraceae bacterium]
MRRQGRLSAFEFQPKRGNGDSNRLSIEDRPVHDWYRFVLSFPPHLVRDYLRRFGITEQHRVLDPFCGTGTTLVECKKLGIASVGIEAHPVTHFASLTKVDWSVDPYRLKTHAKKAAIEAEHAVETCKEPDYGLIGPEGFKLLLKDSISPRPLRKVLLLLESINAQQHNPYRSHELLAFAKVLVFHASNLHFGPEVGVGKLKRDAEVVFPWLESIRIMCDDLKLNNHHSLVESRVIRGDARDRAADLEPQSIDAVITSPPYPNEKDYTRTTRLESVFLGFIRNRKELQAYKRELMRSNTRNVFKGDNDDLWVCTHPEINRLAEEIENRRLELNKTSGFERLYANVAKLYFGGMARHMENLKCALRPGAKLAYVVGDQASYLRIMIRTGHLLADIADSLGYEVLSIDLFRTRLSTATREQLREEVVVLRWPG